MNRASLRCAWKRSGGFLLRRSPHRFGSLVSSLPACFCSGLVNRARKSALASVAPAHAPANPLLSRFLPRHRGRPGTRAGYKFPHRAFPPACHAFLPTHRGIVPTHAGIVPAHVGLRAMHRALVPAHVNLRPPCVDCIPAHAGSRPTHRNFPPPHAGGSRTHHGGFPTCGEFIFPCAEMIFPRGKIIFPCENPEKPQKTPFPNQLFKPQLKTK